MQVHVEDGGYQQLGSHETLVERFLVQYLFNQAVGNDLAGLVMLGIHFQHFGFGGTMLVDLRGSSTKSRTTLVPEVPLYWHWVNNPCRAY